MFDSFEWSLLTVLAPIVLGLALAYALFTRRRMSRAEKDVQDAETRKQYHQDDEGRPIP